MKSHLTWIPVSIIVLTVSLFTPIKDSMVTKKTVSKTVSFALYKENAYEAEVYNNTSAMVHITVEKVTERNRTIVWDTTIAASQLKALPTAENAYTQTITVPGLMEKREQLVIRYVLTYDSKGSQLQMQDWIVAADNNSQLKIAI